METALLPAGSAEALSLAAALLREGELVALPTDTLYGLAANALDGRAVRRVYAAKQRSLRNPLPIFIAGIDDLEQLCREIPDAAWPLLQRFWPGALTVVLRRADRLPVEVAAGGPTVAVRAPDHPIPQALLAELGLPLTATSANRSGGPAPATAQEVERQLAGRLPLILDGGPCPGPTPSTIVDLSVEPPRLVRQGAVPVAALRGLLPAIQADTSSPGGPTAGEA
ncbi:MAG: L-threonylcarbamoyladenylate synthase [Anaerolineae bacterium]